MLKFKIDGMLEMRRELEGIERRSGEWSDFFKAYIKPRLIRDFIEIFKGRNRWKPLKKATLEEKKRLGYPRTKLVRTGRLRKSYTSKSNFRVNKQSLTFRNTVPYARFHEEGVRHRNLPKRSATEEALKRRHWNRRHWKKYITQYVMGGGRFFTE